MKHLTLIVAMMLTCILAAVANVVVARTIDLNVFTMRVWFIVPVGAAIVGMLGTSGALIAARYLQVRPTVIDAAFMVIVAAATMVLIYYLDYATLVLDDGRKVSGLLDFRSYVDLVLTKSHIRMARGGGDAGEAGEMGYYIAAVEFIGFLAGGVATFALIKGLLTCAVCGSYLRRLKTKKTKNVTSDEAGKLVAMFRDAADVDAIRDVIAWTPPQRSLKLDRAIISYSLHGCPQCKNESIVAKVKAFTGGGWKDVTSLATRRNLPPGLSLRDRFA